MEAASAAANISLRRKDKVANSSRRLPKKIA